MPHSVQKALPSGICVPQFGQYNPIPPFPLKNSVVGILNDTVKCINNYYNICASASKEQMHDGGKCIVGLQYILDSEKKKDEGFAQIGYCEFNKSNKDRKEVQIPHDNCNTGHEVQAIPNVLREEIWRSTSVAEI